MLPHARTLGPALGQSHLATLCQAQHCAKWRLGRAIYPAALWPTQQLALAPAPVLANSAALETALEAPHWPTLEATNQTAHDEAVARC